MHYEPQVLVQMHNRPKTKEGLEPFLSFDGRKLKMKSLVWIVLTFSMQTYAAETKFFVKGMTCPMCAVSVKNAFKEILGYEVQNVNVVSIETGEIIVRTKDKKLGKEIVERELRETNFSLKEIDE